MSIHTLTQRMLRLCNSSSITWECLEIKTKQIHFSNKSLKLNLSLLRSKREVMIHKFNFILFLMSNFIPLKTEFNRRINGAESAEKNEPDMNSPESRAKNNSNFSPSDFREPPED